MSRSDWAPCGTCGKPMTCGQGQSNGGAHIACRPTRTVFDAVQAARQDRRAAEGSCFDCWVAILRGDAVEHDEHWATL